MIYPASTHHKQTSPLNDPRYKPAPYTPRRAKFTEVFNPSVLAVNNVSVTDFAYPRATQTPEIKPKPSQSRLRKLFSRSRSRSNSTPCNACSKNESEQAKEKKRVDSAVSLSGGPIQTKSEPRTSISTTPATGIVTLTKMGKAHPGRRWMPGVDLDLFASNPIVPRKTHNSPESESKARLKDRAARDAFFDYSDSEGEEPNFKTRSKTFPEFLQDDSNEPGLLTLVTPRDNGGFEPRMSGALRDVGVEAGEMEFVTVNVAIRDQIIADRAKGEPEARSCRCPCCKKLTFSKRIKALFGMQEGDGKEEGEERGRLRLREEIPRLDFEVQRQLGF